MSKNCSLAETGELLKAAKKLVIVSHVSPDGDTLGSSLALMHALRALGKDVIMNVDDDIFTVKCITRLRITPRIFHSVLTWTPHTLPKGNPLSGNI